MDSYNRVNEIQGVVGRSDDIGANDDNRSEYPRVTEIKSVAVVQVFFAQNCNCKNGLRKVGENL